MSAPSPVPCGRRNWRAALLLVVGLNPVTTTAEPRKPQAPEAARHAVLLQRAELKRNPFLGIGVDLEIRTVSRASGRELRRSQYLMLTHRADRTLVLVRDSEPAAQGALLFADHTYWLLPRDAREPIALEMEHVLVGDLSHVGFLRVNLRLEYEPTDVTEVHLDGVPCWRMRLIPKESSAPFGEVRYWVTKDDARPARIEFHSATLELLKTVRFTSYQDMGLGAVPERIEIEDAARAEETSILTLSTPARVDTRDLRFDLRELVALREFARRSDPAAPVQARPLVEALREATGADPGRAPP